MAPCPQSIKIRNLREHEVVGPVQSMRVVCYRRYEFSTLELPQKDDAQSINRRGAIYVNTSTWGNYWLEKIPPGRPRPRMPQILPREPPLVTIAEETANEETSMDVDLGVAAAARDCGHTPQQESVIRDGMNAMIESMGGNAGSSSGDTTIQETPVGAGETLF